jgi:hypothetical protein
MFCYNLMSTCVVWGEGNCSWGFETQLQQAKPEHSLDWTHIFQREYCAVEHLILL